MTAAVNQDFTTYQGDDVSPIFTVTDASGTVVDISSVLEIQWFAQRNLETAVALTKLKSTGGITFVTNGVDGKFQVLITKTDTTDLSGFYQHKARLTDSAGDITSVTVGRMNVGLPPQWNYDASINEPTAPTVNIVRRIVGDVLPGDKQLQDEEILFAIATYSNIYLAAAECARWIAAMYARKVDTVQGELHTLYSQQFKAYRQMSIDLEMRGMARGGGGMGYAGGISVSDKAAQVANPDRVTPQFNLMMQDDLIPEFPVGNETPGSPVSNSGP